MKRINFFCALFLLVNPSIIIFFLLPTDLLTNKKLPMKNSPTESIAVDDFIDKLITNGMIIQIPTKTFVGKYKDCGSDMVHFLYRLQLNFIYLFYLLN